MNLAADPLKHETDQRAVDRIVFDHEHRTIVDHAERRSRGGCGAWAAALDCDGADREPEKRTLSLHALDPASPPISSARRRTIDRPRPVPPKRRVAETSIWGEWFEQVRLVIPGDADAAVANLEPEAGHAARKGAFAAADVDGASVGELDRIADEV